MVLPKFSGHLTINEIFTERSRKCLKDIGDFGKVAAGFWGMLRETGIWATWEYVSSVGGGPQGMVGLCAHCGCGELVVHHRPTAT